MAKYKTEKGFAVQTLSSDTAASIADTGSWASSTAGNTARGYFQGFGTSQSAAGVVGGSNPSSSPKTATEIWNGTAWTEVNDLPAGQQNQASAGTTTAAFSASGLAPWPNTATTNYEWDGTNWTAGGAVNTARYDLTGAGTLTAGMIAGGNSPGGTDYKNTELYNGSSWTEVNDMNSPTVRNRGGGGTQTAALYAAGEPPTGGKTEIWDGTNWTEVNDLNTVSNGGRYCGTTTAGIFAGGPPGHNQKTEAWDGTSWTEVGDMGSSRQQHGQSGTSTQAIVSFGLLPSMTATAEEWTTLSSFTKTNLGQVYYNSGSNAFKVTATSVPIGSWASGGALNTARSASMGAGAQTAGIVVAGFTPPGYQPVSAITEQYNGSAWTEVCDLNEATSSGGIAHNSPYADTVRYGGNGNTDKTETWNNSSWTAVGDLNTGRIGGSGYGSSSSSAGYAGGDPVSSNINETWDGSSWTEVNNLNSARRYGAGVGTITAALVVAGDTDVPGFPGGRYTARVESWDGSSFTEVGDLNTGGAYRGTSGTQTQAIAFGGGSPSPYQTITESWNGTSWTEVADLANARRAWASGIGTAAGAGLAAGGEGPSSNLDATEEFTAATANSTITLG